MFHVQSVILEIHEVIVSFKEPPQPLVHSVQDFQVYHRSGQRNQTQHLGLLAPLSE